MRRRFMLIACLSIAACSDAERDAAADADGNGSMTANTAAVADPVWPGTVHCARAAGQAQQLVCSDAELAAIASEAERLYRLVAAEPEVDPSQSLVDNERSWAGMRNNCWKADELRDCVVHAYAGRIAVFRTSFPSGRNESSGISTGPVRFKCDGSNGILEATFIRSNPGVVHLDPAFGPERIQPFPSGGVTLPATESASGSKYEGLIDGEPWSFWNKGREATLTRAGEEITCAEQPRAG